MKPPVISRVVYVVPTNVPGVIAPIVIAAFVGALGIDVFCVK